MKFSSFILFMVVPFYGLAQSGATLSLEQCIAAAIKSNLQVQQAKIQAQSANINWNSAKMNMLPDLGATASGGINSGRNIDPSTNAYSTQQINFSSYSISSGVVLFNGLALQQTAAQNRLNYQAAEMDLQQQKNNITLNVILAYLQVLSNEDLLAQSEQQSALTLSQVKRLEILNEEGAISPYVLTDLQGQYANDRLSIINARNQSQTALINLFRLMNMEYRDSVKMVRMDTGAVVLPGADNPQAVYDQALERFALIRANDLRVEGAEHGLKAARGRYFPMLSFNANANTTYSSGARKDLFINSSQVSTGDYVIVNGVQSDVLRQQQNFKSVDIPYRDQLNNNLFSSFNVNLSVPIFNRSFYRNNVRLAKLVVQNNRLSASASRTTLQQDIYQAHANLQASSDRYGTLLMQVKAYSASFDAAEIRFNEGVINAVEYLIAKNNLDRARINLISAKYDYLLRRKVLDYYSGDLNVEVR